jgi:nicotinamidase-related amidase
MPLTALDSSPALVVIDLQKGVVGLPTVHPVADVIGRAALLARAFRGRKSPVVLVSVTGTRREDGMVTFSAKPGRGRTDAGISRFSPPSDWAELVPELEPRPGDLIVTKPRWSAFVGTTLHDDLSRRGVSQVFLTGVATSIGVESTARGAHDL